MSTVSLWLANNGLAAWGAVLSTSLAVIKFVEMWKQRFRVVATYQFTSDPNIGNEVILTNLAAKPVLVSYWTLEWTVRRLCFLRRVVDEIEPEDMGGRLTIPPHGDIPLLFREFDHFAWSPVSRPKQRLYIRLNLAGRRKPIRLFVYDANR